MENHFGVRNILHVKYYVVIVLQILQQVWNARNLAEGSRSYSRDTKLY
jgi:hypothetical protein